MSNINPPGPSSPKPDESIPQDVQKAKSKSEKPAFNTSEDTLTYLGFTFNSKKAYLEFKNKFLARMSNEMMRQIKSNNERMLKSLKKLREND